MSSSCRRKNNSAAPEPPATAYHNESIVNTFLRLLIHSAQITVPSEASPRKGKFFNYKHIRSRSSSILFVMTHIPTARIQFEHPLCRLSSGIVAPALHVSGAEKTQRVDRVLKLTLEQWYATTEQIGMLDMLRAILENAAHSLRLLTTANTTTSQTTTVNREDTYRVLLRVQRGVFYYHWTSSYICIPYPVKSRPARPMRCTACSCDTGSVVIVETPFRMSNRLSFVFPKQMDHLMHGIVIETPPTFVQTHT